MKRLAPVLAAAFLLLPDASRAQTAEPSYWGPIPAAEDSTSVVTVKSRDRSMPVWEGALYWPVRIAAEPLVLVADGLGETVEFLDETKILYRINKLLAPRRGPFGVVLGFQAGGLSGIGGGLTVEHDAFLGRRGNLLRVRGNGSVNGDTRASLGSRIPLHHVEWPPGTRMVPATEYFEFGVGYRERSNARYFGIGPFTRKEDESFYYQELFWGGAAVRKKVAGRVSAEIDLLYSNVFAGEPRKDSPPITTEFAGALPPGFDEHSYGVSAGLQLSHEDEVEVGRVTHGGTRRIRVERFKSTDKHVTEFWSYRAELQQSLTLWHPYRVLALRSYVSWLDPVGDDVIPFQRLLINDTPDAFRGFRSFRFRDRGMIALNSEYRFPLWTNERPGAMGLDLYPLADWGQVFDDRDQIGFDQAVFSYGLGIRLESSYGFLARLEFAHSDEETTFLFRADQLFRFPKLGFLYGRDPIPAR